MDFFEDNYFDVIALPAAISDENLCIQPSDYIPSSIYGDSYQYYTGIDDAPSYTELTTSTSSAITQQPTELDQFLIFDCDDSFSYTTFDNLPDQTLMCTDSCAAFIKESSEILRVNSLKIQQQDEVSLSSVDEVKSDEKVSFYCNFGDCKKTYSKPAHLRAHLRRHLGLKPYFCNFPNCSWKFSRSDELGKYFLCVTIFCERLSYFYLCSTSSTVSFRLVNFLFIHFFIILKKVTAIMKQCLSKYQTQLCVSITKISIYMADKFSCISTKNNPLC